jgi:transposase-like protein
MTAEKPTEGQRVCPKCGSEMRAEHFPDHSESHYECLNCDYRYVYLGGHEEKVA